MEWYLTVLRKYAQFSGRSRRSEYWYFVLFNMLISIGLAIVDSVLGLGAGGLGLLGLVYMLAVFIPGLAVTIRRLHDTSRSGWWLLVAFIPLIGAIVLLVFLASDSTPGPNEYGANPKQGEFVPGGVALG